MKVAVLMSTYNGEKYIRDQIESILNQKGDFFIDLWVRDDGSKDGTQRILEEYKLHNKLRWYKGPNMGPALSFLDLLMQCKDYDFYAFADQDDYWDPNKIQIGINIIREKRGMQLYFANAELVDTNLEPIGRTVYKERPRLDFKTLSCAGGLLGCTMIMNNELTEIIQKQSVPQNTVMHDFYVAEVCLALGGEITYDSTPVMKYRQHGNNVVGVSHGVIGILKNRVTDITKKPKVSIADQAKDILNLYGDDISTEKKDWLKKISIYNITLLRRLALATSRDTNYINKNMGLKLRLSILLGNR